MWRWIVRILAVFLLLLSSAIAVLWVRSYFFRDSFMYVQTVQQEGHWPCRSLSADTCAGRLYLEGLLDENFWELSGGKPYLFSSARGGQVLWSVQPGEKYWEGAGFQFVRGSQTGMFRMEYARVMVPLWFLFLLTAIFPAIIAFRYLHRRRRSQRGFPVGIIEPH